MTDANIAVTFSATTGDFEAGISSARQALASLAAPIEDLNGKYAALGASLAESHQRALQAIKSGDETAYADSVRAAQDAIAGQIKAEQSGLRDRLAAYADDARNYRITEQEKVASSREAIEQSYAAEFDLTERKRALAQGSLAARQTIDNQISQLERNEQRDLAQLTRSALEEQTRDYQQFGAAVTSAFNSQLRGLLAGSETWGAALKRTLGDLIIQFIEFNERTVVAWAAGEVAKTQASAAGAASRTAIAQAGASSTLAAQGASIVRSILSSAAEAFAGVFGFLAPLLGPFAAGPAAAAQATVAGAAASVASADIGMWNVPADMLTLVHHNELIMPASEAGQLRNMLAAGAPNGDAQGGSVSIAPTTHFHVNALDGRSVSDWMRSNSSGILRAVDEAVRHGAHLGLRRLGT